MIVSKTDLVSKLSTDTGLTVYYELFCDGRTPTPCITYIESNNYTVAEGEDLGYSRVQYLIKLWGNDLATLETKALLLDVSMRQMGFKRTTYNELSADNQIQLVFTYEALGKEYFNENEVI